MAQIGSYNSPIKIDEENNVEIQKDLEIEGDLKANVDLGYISYVALLNQSGSNAPVSEIFYNDTNENLTWSFNSNGNYSINSSSGIFTSKSLVFINNGSMENDGLNLKWEIVSNNEIRVFTSGGNGYITNGSFEVRIYN